METIIHPKGTNDLTGLPKSIVQTGMYWNKKADCIEIYWDVFETNPNGTKRLLKEDVDYIQDLPAIAEIKNESGEIVQAAVIASTKYTDYCKQFNADGIMSAIDIFLETI